MYAIIGQIVVIGYPIGLFLKKRILSDQKIAGLVSFVYGFTLEFLLYSTFLNICYSWEEMPIPVGCQQFLPAIFASLLIGVLGIAIMVYHVNRQNE